jgi:purine-nucleoside phosphorylase
MTAYYIQLQAAQQELRRRIGGHKPKIAIILGSGLGGFANEVTNRTPVPYDVLPHFPVSTVAGHAGQFVVGELEGKQVLLMQGRFHAYEGYSLKQVVFPIYVMKMFGIELLIITNAAGGLNRAFMPGDLMLISDHMNFTGDNPLIGSNEPELGERFPDMSQAYDRQLISLARRWSATTGRRLVEGVYCGIRGPSYMTPAELTWLAKVGGDAIGMSTVAETIAARHAGMRVLGISCITDMAIGDSLEPLSHAQVVAVANETQPKFIELLRHIVRGAEI